MDFCTISDDFFDLCTFDNELLYNKSSKRPYLVILKLKYIGNEHEFAIPFRSNIPSHIKKEQYFSLPPRSTTKSGYIHGLHYIKMFPVKSIYLKQFFNNDANHKIVKKIIIGKRELIKKDAQNYLAMYESGVRVPYSTDIERIYTVLNPPL